VDFRSVAAGGSQRADWLAEHIVPTLVEALPVKFWWFLKNNYRPHAWQATFHGARSDGKLARFRHLVAGRRGGKTMSAAWEVLFYCLHPDQFHLDAHGAEKERPLWVWVLAKDYKVGRPSLLTFLEAMDQAGLVKDRDYRYNKTERIIEFTNGSLVEFKTAEDPQSLRGAGLDILWIDEAAFITNEDAWLVVRPALSDRLGLVITTTTPKGKNWFHAEFWSDESKADERQFRVEYTSIDNPYFPREEWEYARTHYHPLMFRQEYLASFDAMAGVELSGDWLKYYVVGRETPLGNPDDVRLAPRGGLRTYIGIDPAVSLSDKADRFAMALIGVAKDGSQAYLLELYADRIPFPDQITKIQEWHLKYRPDLIGIESNAYQRALAQQAMRIPGLPPIVPVISKGKKEERILAMAPLFKIGRVRIHRRHRDFIEEWVSYDSSLKNTHDDTLDATEIALGVAGVILPRSADAPLYDPLDRPASDMQELVRRSIVGIGNRDRPYDEEMGADF
jgi:predicted phage terminase large subunit-like protein